MSPGFSELCSHIHNLSVNRDGIEAWNGEYGVEEYAFWKWRCFKNNDELSEYWIKNMYGEYQVS